MSKRISELPSTGVIGAGDYFVVVQSGVTKKFDLSGQVTLGTIIASQSQQFANLTLTGTLNANLVRVPDGSAATPTLSFQSATGTGAFRNASGNYAVAVDGVAVARVSANGVATTGVFGLEATPGAGADVLLSREGANILSLRNSTSNQILRIYGTHTDSSNYERFALRWTATAIFLMTEQAGSGSSRQLILGTVGASDIVFRTTDTARWNINASGHFLASTDNAYDIGASGATRPRNIYVAGFVNSASLVSTTWMAVADGISAPSAQAGQARIYVDTADGDLKVIFGDGQVKTIVVDT